MVNDIAPASQDPPATNNIPLRIAGNLVELPPWRWLGFGSVILLFVLKGIQGSLSTEKDKVTSMLGFFVYAFAHRITNISLWFVVFGFISIWIIVNFVQDWIRLGHLWANGIELKSKWIAFAFVLSFAEVGLYLSAVYRDGGTFFIQIGWGQDRTPIAGIYAIQVIEGLLFCFLLCLMSFWTAVAHAAYSERQQISPTKQKALYEKTVNQIIWMTLFPLFVFLGLSALKIGIDLKTGIANSAFAVATAILMWAAFGWLFLRVILDPRLRIEGAFTAPFFKVVLHGEGSPQDEDRSDKS